MARPRRASATDLRRPARRPRAEPGNRRRSRQLTSYFDSSALVPLYVLEIFSGSAKREARRVRQLVFTALHDLEVRGTLRRLAGRGVISPPQLEQSLLLLDSDLSARRLARRMPDFSRVFERAADLSARYASKLLCRSLDVLHVASALELGIKRFVSANDRQTALARECGLAVTELQPDRRS